MERKRELHTELYIHVSTSRSVSAVLYTIIWVTRVNASECHDPIPKKRVNATLDKERVGKGRLLGYQRNEPIADTISRYSMRSVVEMSTSRRSTSMPVTSGARVSMERCCHLLHLSDRSPCCSEHAALVLAGRRHGTLAT